METKHTPGPWNIGKPAPDMNTRCAIRDVDGWEIAEIPGLTIDQPHERQDANAHLIAAAPDMLNALTLIADGACMNNGQPYSYADVVLAYQELARKVIKQITK